MFPSFLGQNRDKMSNVLFLVNNEHLLTFPFFGHQVKSSNKSATKIEYSSASISSFRYEKNENTK